MNDMEFIKISIYFFTALLLNACSGQPNSKAHLLVGGPCEGCEAILEYNNRALSSTDTLSYYEENEPKLKITGTVYLENEITPASDIILYIYHTNREGLYLTKSKEKGWIQKHGSLRGWVKTGIDGKYTYHTFRPAAYPDGREPEHIHITVKEPDKNEYYIDSIVFDDDPLLTESVRDKLENRCGSGIVKPILKNGILNIKRDIILGMNIPNY